MPEHDARATGRPPVEGINVRSSIHLARRAPAGFFLLCVTCLLAGCGDDRPSAGTPGGAASRPAGTAPSSGSTPADPNAENPDRDRFVDLATLPFNPAWVGGRLVQLRTLPASINALQRVGGSMDVQRLHKYLLSVPLLMEEPDARADGFHVVPHGAAAFPEESPDHLRHVWRLRTDLTWEDGRPLTAADYAFTFQLMRTAGVQAAAVSAECTLVKDVRALAADQLEVTWTRPSSRGVYTFGLDFPVLPAHAIPAGAEAFNATATHLSCGPYRIGSFAAGRLELVLRDEYRARAFPLRPHYVERIAFEPGGDPAAAFARIVNGEAHLAGLTADQFAGAATEKAFQAVAWRTQFYLSGFSFIAWNLHDPADPEHRRPHPILADGRVREALSHLLPLQQIAQTTFRGLARPVTAPFDFRDAGVDPSVLVRAFDPARARALLDEAGWMPGDDGVRKKDGRPLEITLARPPSAHPLFTTVPQILQDEARKVGVTVTIDARADALSEAGGHRVDAVLALWQADVVEPDLADQFHSRNAFVESSNYAGIADAAVDRALDGIDATFDRVGRNGLRRAIHRRLHELVPCTFLLANATTLAVSRAFANVRVHDLGVRYHDFVSRDLFEKSPPRPR